MIWHAAAAAVVAAAVGTWGGWWLRGVIADRAQAEAAAHVATAREEVLHAALVTQANAARTALQRADQARRDAAAAGRAADSLRLAAAAAAGQCAEGGDSARGAGDLLADMLGRMEAHGRELAAYADAARISGQQCDAQ